MRADLLLRNGTITDGSGRPSFTGDLAIQGERIVSLERGACEAAAVEIDVTGLVVAPGFIDVHTHYDAQVLWDPYLDQSLQYGFTTVVTGNCGFGIAPIPIDGESYAVQLLARVEGMPAEVLRDGVPWA